MSNSGFLIFGIGNAAINEERAAYCKTIDDLQKKIAQLDQIRVENEKLKARVDANDERTRGQSETVPLVEFEHVKSQLERCKVDYSRIRTARSMLETKCRHYKESLREWKEYSRDYLRRNPGAKRGHDSRISNQVTPSANAMDVEFASDPPPPSYAGTTSLSSDLSRSISPLIRPPSHPRTRTPSAHPDNLSSPQAKSKQHFPRGLEDLVETFDDSDAETGVVDEDGNSRKKDSFARFPVQKEVETGDSSPVVVFERKLKQKKSNKTKIGDIHIHEDPPAQHEEQECRRAKSENGQLSSSLLQSSRLANQQGYIGESLDLDEVEGTLYTPRKRQRLEQTVLKSSKLASFNHSPVAIHAEITDKGDPLDPQEPRIAKPCEHAAVSTENDDLLFTESVEVEAHRRNARKGAKTDYNYSDTERLSPELATKGASPSPSLTSPETELRSTERLHVSESEQRDVYHSPDISRRNQVLILPRTSAERTRKMRRRPPNRRGRGAAQVPALAEDGEGTKPPDLPKTSVDKASGRDLPAPAMTTRRAVEASNAHTRLAALLNDPSASKTPLSNGNEQQSLGNSIETPTSSRLPEQRGTKALATPQSLPVNQKSEAPVSVSSKSALQPRTTRTNLITYSKNRASSGDGPSDIFPEYEPLRARPLHRLRLEDFRLNPNHSNYAYHETIRKHDEKKIRSGCTDPFCQRCKDVKKFAEMSGYSATKKAGLYDSSPPEGVKTNVDDNLLEDFLGDDAYRLAKMGEKEKKDLLVKARTKQFTDRFGKHRQGFSKPPEPPGFWMTDFPSTQENEQFAEEAQVMERTKIEERREEAVRRGTWLFADEV